MFRDPSSAQTSGIRILFWILCLAFLAVGARNFENGLSIDGPLYATIARNIITTGEWFKLDSWVPDFSPAFAEHPHLGFWILAASVKYFGAADWALRIPGHLFYIAFLFTFFRFIRSVSNEKTAVLTILYLWSMSVFSNYFSNAYLDPGCLYFGFLSFYFLFKGASDFKRSNLLAGLFSGLFLALALLQKGFTILGFGLPLLYALFLLLKNRGALKTFLTLVFFFAAFSIVLYGYFVSVRNGNDPDFFERYFERQYQNRFAHTMSLWNLFNSRFWISLVRDSYYISLAGLGWLVAGALMFRNKVRFHEFMVPFVFLISFVFLYATHLRFGSQYWVMILPWVAWATINALGNFIPLQPKKIIGISSVMALVLVAFIQYIPIRTHSSAENESSQKIRNLKSRGIINQQIIDDVPELLDFITAAPYAWYGNTPVAYNDSSRTTLPAPHSGMALILRNPTKKRIDLAVNQGWCLNEVFPKETLLIHCSSSGH